MIDVLFSNSDPLNGKALPFSGVNVKYATAENRSALCRLVSGVNTGLVELDHLLTFRADNRIFDAAHAQIADKPASAGKHSFICGLHMGMRSPNSADPAVKASRKGRLLAGCLPMEIAQGEVVLPLQTG